MIGHSTGNRKVLGLIPSGVKAFRFLQKFFFKKLVILEKNYEFQIKVKFARENTI